MKSAETSLSASFLRFNFVRINIKKNYVAAVRFCNWFGEAACVGEINPLITCYRCVSSNDHVNTQNQRYSVYKPRLKHEIPLCDTKFRE
jgi:nitric oxide synthase oxygenase domain/subunit